MLFYDFFVTLWCLRIRSMNQDVPTYNLNFIKI